MSLQHMRKFVLQDNPSDGETCTMSSQAMVSLQCMCSTVKSNPCDMDRYLVPFRVSLLVLLSQVAATLPCQELDVVGCTCPATAGADVTIWSCSGSTGLVAAGLSSHEVHLHRHPDTGTLIQG